MAGIQEEGSISAELLTSTHYREAPQPIPAPRDSTSMSRHALQASCLPTGIVRCRFAECGTARHGGAGALLLDSRLKGIGCTWKAG